MNKVLLLTDFSVAARHAISFAQALFDDTATNFCVLNTFELQPKLTYGGAILLAEERETAELAMHNFLRLITKPPVPAYHTYRTLTALGSPETAVESLLTQESFDLVVVGASGSGFSEFFGSVATGLIRSAKANVLVVPASAPIRPLERVVLATDFRSVNDIVSLALLKTLVARKAAQLTMLTIENPRQEDSKPSEISKEYIEQVFDEVQTDLYTIHDEDVLHGINTYLDVHTVDMLVVLPHHKRFFDLLTNKSVSRSIAYKPRVPLLALYDAETPAPKLAGQTVDVIPFI